MVDHCCPHCKFELAGAEKYTNCPNCQALLPRWEMKPEKKSWLQKRREKAAEVRKVREEAEARQRGQDYQKRDLSKPYQPPTPGAMLKGQVLDSGSTGPIDPNPARHPTPGAPPTPDVHRAMEQQAHYDPAPYPPPSPEPIENPESALDDQVLCPNCGLINRLESTEELEQVICQYCKCEIEL